MWSVPFQELSQRFERRVDDVWRIVTLTLFQRIVMRSPVDTGRFRANWLPSYGQINTTVTAAIDPSGSAKQSEIRSAVLSFPVGGTAYLCNSLPYAAVLEYGLYPNPAKRGSKKRGEEELTIHTVNGFSKQAPAGMVRVTAQELEGAMAEALRRLPPTTSS